MAIVTSADLRDTFVIPEDFPAGPIDSAIGLASLVLIKYVGQTAYDDAAIDGNTCTDPTRREFLKQAEQRVAFYYVLGSASGIRRPGMVREETDAGLGGGTVRNVYFSPKEIAERRAAVLSEALDLMAPYRADDGELILDAGAITVGTILPADFEPETILEI